jgi:tetratricopeptide (TPR) repeat protein
LFKKSIELDSGQPRFFVLNPFTSLLVDLTLDGKIPTEEAKKYQQIIMKTIEKGLADCEKNRDCENWGIIKEYAPARLEALESIKGFYDCDYYVKKYHPVFEANPNDCETINTVYSRLRFGGCETTMAELQTINQAYNKNCKEETGPSCNDLLREGQYKEAIDCLEKAIAVMTDNKDKATYKLFIAKIYYAHLKSFSRARKYAREAAKLRSGWGEPYLLIGTLYASSGPLCGPGRGWDSQRVVWPAIDMWAKAKKIDPNARAEAQKLINQYTQYMPERGDIFQRGLQEGQSYLVPCWIQETTTIRARP